MTCQVIRVGVFFDGTGNNLFNDEAKLSKNGVSNIGIVCIKMGRC
ncbi:hypothetical protein [Rodentibacter pneumotropicus]|nr:hypothetical protein [Rodentibacter pneumotropicus]